MSSPPACWGLGGLEAQLWSCFTWLRLAEVTIKASVGTAQPKLSVSLTRVPFVFQFKSPQTLPSLHRALGQEGEITF